MPSLSRRTFLLASASAVALGACGGGDDDDDGEDGVGASSTTTAAEGMAIARVFAPQQPVGRELRLPIALTDADGTIRREGVPATITYAYAGGAPIEVARHDEGIPTPYFPLAITIDAPGEVSVEVTAGDETATTTIVGVDATQVPAVPGPGDALIAVATPTTADARGVAPICTREPACPFHDVTLEEAMASGKAVAFLVSTPAFCQTAICGPVLDLLIDRAAPHADVLAVVHAEVYTDDTARTTTEGVQTYGLAWEPALFLAMPDGTITSRLDYTYDGVELDAVLSRLVQ